MTSISSAFFSGIARVPNALSSGVGLRNIQQGNVDLFRVSNQLSTGRDLLTPSQDVIRAAAIQTIDGRLDRSEQQRRNLELADGDLATPDSSVGDATGLLQEAYALALEQLSFGTSAAERAAQATVIQSSLDSYFRVTSRESTVGFVFGGTEPGRAPVESVGESFLVNPSRGGLVTDLGFSRAVPVTVGADSAVAPVSTKMDNQIDLQPNLTLDTRLSEVNGTTELGVGGGTIMAMVDGAELTIDLTDADTIGDVVDRITAGIRAYEATSGTTILGTGGVSLSGGSISIDSPTMSIEFADVQGGTTGQDLGLVGSPAFVFDSSNPLGQALTPELTFRTPVSALGAITTSLGSIRLSNGGVSAVVDLSGAQTVDDIKGLIEAAVPGVVVEINDAKNGLAISSSLSTSSSQALSIEEVTGQNQTASRLGIRTFSLQTQVSDLNFGRGVTVLSQAPDPQFNVDFEIELGDGFTIPIDLQPADMVSIGTVISAVNIQAEAALTAAGRPLTDFSAGLLDGSNGITLNQDAALGGEIKVLQRNNSPAAEHLGLLGGTLDPTGAQLVGEDRARMRAESVFTHLIDLRDALENNDEFGMQLAADDLEAALDGLTTTRAQVGGYARLVQDETVRHEDRTAVDEQTRSMMADVDFAAAATEFTLLQTQLQASMQVTAISNQLSLLNFL